MVARILSNLLLLVYLLVEQKLHIKIVFIF